VEATILHPWMPLQVDPQNSAKHAQIDKTGAGGNCEAFAPCFRLHVSAYREPMRNNNMEAHPPPVTPMDAVHFPRSSGAMYVPAYTFFLGGR
jgi:hypothetical protein